MADAGFDRERELELVRRVIVREPAASELFAERMKCIPRFFGWHLARLGPRGGDDVKDLSQTVMVTVLRNLPKYAGHSSLERWAFGFCRNELRNHWRRMKRDRRSSSLDGDGPAAPDEKEDLDTEHLHRLLQRISGYGRDAIHLRFFEGLPFAEIALRLGVTESNAKSIFVRAMAKLQRLLEGGASPEA